MKSNEGGNMIKIITALAVFSINSYCVNIEGIKSDNFAFNINKTDVLMPSFSVESKYNQQNIALSKIKINEIDPDMDNSVILKLQKGDINFYLNDLKKDGFDAQGYPDGSGFYFIMVNPEGRNVASEALGLAKYYYVKEVLVSRKTYNELFNPVRKSKFSIATKEGTITGGMNYSPVNITINKLEWTIKGVINHSPVDIKIDNENKTIKGVVNLSPVDLKFDWSVEDVSVYGEANHSPVKYTINWKNGLLEGYSNNAPIKLEFDMKEGVAGDNTVEINGYANYSPVSLKFDKASGELTGAMNHSPVEIKLVKCDLYDFLQYIFIFLNTNN
jgi:hypothetical protein